MGESATCVECGEALRPGETVCRFCEEEQAYVPSAADDEIMEIRRRLHRSRVSAGLGLILLPWVLQPIGCYHALVSWRNLSSLRDPPRKLIRQAVGLAVVSAVLTALYWYLLVKHWPF